MSKEATAYVVDIGRSMGREKNGRAESDLDWSLKYVWDKITSDVATARKTLFHAVVGFRTDGTAHDMPAEEAYDNITVYQEFKATSMPDLRNLRTHLKASRTDSGDVLSAIVTASEMVATFCKANKYTKKIVVITNASGVLDDSDLAPITARLKDLGIEIIVLGVDFDDADFGFKEEHKDERKAKNEKLLKKLADDCGGAFGTMAEAIAELGIPGIKVINSLPTYRGWLTLGDPENYDTAMCIDIERFAKIMPATAPSAGKFALKVGQTGDAIQDVDVDIDERSDGNAIEGLTALEQKSTYTVADADAPGGKRDVDREDLAKGYEYGRTVVPISESDQLVLSMETIAGYEIIGFVPEESYPHYMNLSKTNVIIGQRTNDKAILALSSFIHALYEAASHAVARVVQKDGKSPFLVLLSAEITKDYECLYENELPFHEDIRSYRFPPLDYILTMSGKTLKVHRNLPSKDLQNAMDDFVDQMDISNYDRDDAGEPSEYLPMDDTYAVINHRLQQVIKHRAVHPDGEIPPPTAILLKPERPPPDLLEKLAPCLKRLEIAADVKKVPPKAGFRRSKRNTEQPVSGLDVSKLLEARYQATGYKIDPKNAIPEFLQMFAVNKDDEYIRPAAVLAEDGIAQMSEIIENWIRNSFGDLNYDRVVEALVAMKGIYIELEEPNRYNEYLLKLKSQLLGEELNGDRTEMFWKLRASRTGLIKNSEMELSSVDDEQAQSFWNST